MTKFFRFALAALVLGFALTEATPAQAGWLEFFFPTLKQQGPDPMKTLQAPFAMDPNAKPDETVKVDPSKAILAVNGVPMDQPHRDNNEIAEWITTATSEVLNFDKNNYQDSLKEDEKYFTPEGFQQYTAFLNDNNIMKVLQSNRFQIRSFVQDTPLLLNEGAVNGTYRWLYEVPLMLSYLDRGVKDYKQVEPVNQQIVLTVQVGRIPSNSNDMAVLIERFDGRVQAVAKK